MPIADVLSGDARYAVECADCFTLLAALPDNSIDLILTDPPYFSTGKAEVGDRQWRRAPEFIAWIEALAVEWARVLKPNGSLYCFASPQMAARVELAIGERLNVLNSITWLKHDGTYNRGGLWSRANKEALRTYFPQSERIIFAEHYGSDSTAMGGAGYDAKCDELRGFVFEPLRAYLDGERKRAGIDKADCNVACGFSHSAGGMASRHYFSRSQWCLPTREHYEALQRLFNAGGLQEFLRRDYEDLRRDYEDLRRDYEDLRRPFTVSADVPYTDVWDFPTVGTYPGKHPCEKPAAMMDHIIAASSRPDAVVLDCFAGSGATGVSAMRHGRRFIGGDMSQHWSAYAQRRIGDAIAPRLTTQPLFVAAR